jgi:hypothetical protein
MAVVPNKLRDGHGTKVAFTSTLTKLEEVEVTPPGMEGGEPVDQTTMRNVKWRTSASRRLRTLTPMTLTAAYDPSALSELVDLINAPDELITVEYPDGSTYAFWGYIQNFSPEGLSEGNRPQASVTIVPTNLNGSGVETDPVFTPAP